MDMVAMNVLKHGLMVRVTDEVIEDSQWDVLGMWLNSSR